MIETLRADYPVSLLCAVVGLPRSSFYYPACPAAVRPAAPETTAPVSPVPGLPALAAVLAAEATVLAAIEQVLMRWPFYGYRRLVAQLRREGIVASERLVRRLLRQLHSSRSVGRVRVATTDSRHSHVRYPNLLRRLSFAYSDQAWMGDITYIRLGLRFIYLAVILDGYTRSVRGWAVGRQVDQNLTSAALRQALTQGRPDIFHSDQGVQYAACEHTKLLRNSGVRISMSDIGRPTQNALVERFIRTLKEEHVDYADYADLADAQRQLQHWLEVEYMTQRIHSALGYLTPAEFAQAAVANRNTPLATGT
jgi:transposase InsO family protein